MYLFYGSENDLFGLIRNIFIDYEITLKVIYQIN
jgi:hypothetical protein